MRGKHELPVEESCPWWHVNSIERRSDVCATPDGDIRNYMDLWSCADAAGCELTGDIHLGDTHLVEIDVDEGYICVASNATLLILLLLRHRSAHPAIATGRTMHSAM